MRPEVVVLDAMGVLYRHGNVVRGVLQPYLHEHGCSLDEADIREVYRRCTLGEITTEELWASLGVAATACDTDYCQRHELTAGTEATLRQLRDDGIRLVVLTNDAARWSLLLRQRFGLERFVDRWFVSAEIGTRKPDPAAYQAVVDQLPVEPRTAVVVDDRPTNLAAARAAGFQPILFESDDTHAHPWPDLPAPRARGMSELRTLVHRLGR